jgi:hypothetical protein
MLNYPFTEEDSSKAYLEWGANCGPNALAFALQIPLEKVRGLIPDFEAKRYTSPTMMKKAIANAGRTFVSNPADIANMFRISHGGTVNLTRIQWAGPWTQPGANPKWAYRQTHWIATWGENSGPCREWVFDVNGGVMCFVVWKQAIVPILTAATSRADGGWFPTHVWQLDVRAVK